MLQNETGNKMVTPDKKEEVVHVVHIPGHLFTTNPGLLGTLCAMDHNWQHRNNSFHFFRR